MNETTNEKSELEEIQSPSETSDSLPVDHTQDLEEIKESLQLIQEQVQQETEVPEVVTGIDQFLIDNGELIVEVLSLSKWWLFIGVPLICVISVFWIVYKQFLYTKI